jgi:hypothetical protein
MGLLVSSAAHPQFEVAPMTIDVANATASAHANPSCRTSDAADQGSPEHGDERPDPFDRAGF